MNEKRQPHLIELKGPKLFPWQADVIRTLFANWNDTIHVIKSKRQVGKSVMLENILLKTAIEKKNTDSFVLSPTNAQAEKIFAELLNAIKRTPVYRTHNASNHVITFSNSSQIFFKSAEQRENLRGYTVTGILCIDEAAYISDSVISDVLPWVDANRAPVVFTSTPVGKQGMFYNFFIEGLKDNHEKYFCYDWSKYDTSQLLTAERKEFYRRTLPKDKYITDILGEFLQGDSAVFGDFTPVLTNEYNKSNITYYFGIDWGSGVGGDYTVVSIFNSEKQMVAIVTFNHLDETQTINAIVELARQYRPVKITVETNSIGRVFYGLLDKALKANQVITQLKGFNTTNETKERIINELQIGIQTRTITLLDNEELQTQLSMFEMKLTANNKKVYNAKQGYHDDIIMATAICLNSINTGNYNLL